MYVKTSHLPVTTKKDGSFNQLLLGVSMSQGTFTCSVATFLVL